MSRPLTVYKDHLYIQLMVETKKKKKELEKKKRFFNNFIYILKKDNHVIITLLRQLKLRTVINNQLSLFRHSTQNLFKIPTTPKMYPYFLRPAESITPASVLPQCSTSTRPQHQV